MTEAKTSHTIGFVLRLTGNNSVGKNMTLFDLTSMTAPWSARKSVPRTPVLYTVGLYSPSSYYTQNMNLSE